MALSRNIPTGKWNLNPNQKRRYQILSVRIDTVRRHLHILKEKSDSTIWNMIKAEIKKELL